MLIIIGKSISALNSAYTEKEKTMSKRGNSIVVPEAKEALERFKMEAASDEGVQNHIKKNNF